MAVNPNEDTEWATALKRAGVLPGQEEQLEKDEKRAKLVQPLSFSDVQEPSTKTLEEKYKESISKGNIEQQINQLEENEDLDLEDNRLYEEYKRQRLKELNEQHKKSRYGSLIEIKASQYVDEVNKAPKDIWVIVHLYDDSSSISTKANGFLSQLSQKFPACKFIKIKSSECFPGFPPSNYPAFLIYQNDDLKQQIFGLTFFGGSEFTVDDLEWVFAQCGAIKTTLKENPIAERAMRVLRDLGFIPS